MLDKILYIEDDIDTREEISFFLKNKTKELIVGSDGEEGLELFKKHCPSVVISDINMPNMNGLDMSKSIMEIDSQAHIVLLTAHNDAKNLHQAITTGIKEYLVKPIDFQELSEKIDFFHEMITEKQEKQEKYQLLKEYKYAVDSSTIFIKMDLDGKLIYVNDSFCKALNYAKEEIEGCYLSEFGVLSGELHQIFKEVENNHTWSGKVEFASQEQLAILVDGHFFAMLDANKQINSVMAILHDITEVEYLRQIVETKLHQAKDSLEEKTHYIVENEKILEHGIAMCRVDRSGRILKTSDAFNELFEANFMVGSKKKIQDFLGWKHQSFNSMVKSLNKNTVYKDSLEISYEGKLKFFKITCIGISNFVGDFEEIVIVFEDVSKIIAQHGKMYDMQIEFLYMLSEIIEKHSEEASFHTKRVSEYSALLAREIGMNKDEVEHVRLAAIMHDIGKIGVPHEILVKSGSLNSRERFAMQRHSKIGYEILSQTNQPLLQTAAIIAYEHHERWDGNGYPRRLKGKEIHIYGRIVAIADVFDALSKQRVYKKPWFVSDVYKYLEVNRGIQFDPELIDIFLSLKPMIENIRNNY